MIDLPSKRLKQLNNLVVMVTGAGTGFGQAVALDLMRHGATVLLVGRRADMLKQTLDLSLSHVGRGIINPCDITKEDQVSAMLNRVWTETGGVSGLVNCAASPVQRGNNGAPLFNIFWDEFIRLFEINVLAIWNLTTTIIKRCGQSKSLRVVNFSSGAGWASVGSVGPYNVTKAALNNLSMSLAFEASLARPDLDLQINAINPGEARSEMNSNSKNDPSHVSPLVLKLLTAGLGGPTGRFFDISGRGLRFTSAKEYFQDF